MTPFSSGTTSGEEDLGPPDGDAAALVDHVWGNVRVFLGGQRLAAACELGGDRLGPHLSELADRTIAVGDRVKAGPGWSATVAGPEAAPFADASFDLVVVEDAARTGREVARVHAEAQRLCRSTGWVVIGSSSRRVTRELLRGFEPSAGSVYAALPTPRHPAVLVDPRDRKAGTYFMRRVAFPYRSPGRSGLKGRLEQLRNRAALAVPGKVALGATSGRVAVLPAVRAPASLLEEIVSFIGSSWEALALPGKSPDLLTPLVISHRNTPAAVVSVVLFGGAVPLVAKLPRYGGKNAALRREADTLATVYRAIVGPLQATLPRPLGVHLVGDTDVLLQTAVPGRHLVAETASKRLSRQMLRRQLDLMLSWSSDLQAASGRWVTLDDGLIDEKLVPLADAAVAALGGDSRVEALLDQAIERARSLAGTQLRMVVVHGDYWAGNALVHRGRVTGVVDWERAAIDDLPIWDPVKAVMDAAFHLDRYRSVPRRGPRGLPRWGELGPWQATADPHCGVGFRAAVVEPGWLSELAKDALTAAFVDAQIPLGWLPVALPFHLVREFLQPDGPVAGWGSVLRALAASPGTWADEFAGVRRGASPVPVPGSAVGDRLPARGGDLHDG
jgi:Phosphotransferase enzyme family/Methyltransferase domain